MNIINIPRGEAKPEKRTCGTCKHRKNKRCRLQDAKTGKHGTCAKWEGRGKWNA